jgi:phage-related protein
MTVKFGEMQEMLGGKLLPVISALADFFTKYMDVLIPLAGIIIGLVAAMKIYNLIMGIMAIVNSTAAATTWAWTAALLANPLVWIVIGIMALIAALILAYMKIGWFRDMVDAAFSGVKAAFGWVIDIAKEVFEWIKDHWPLLLAIITGPIGIAVLLITKNFDTIKDAVKAAVDWVMDRFQDLTGFLSRIVGSIQGILSSIAAAIRYPIDAATEAVKWVMDKFNELLNFFSNLISTIGGYVSDIADAITGPINAVIRAWNNLSFTVPKIHVPGTDIDIGGNTINFPDIPTLARGGAVLRTGMALVHEGETFSGVGRSLGAPTYNITIQTTGLGADAPQIQRAVVQALRGYAARNGPPSLSATGIA